MDKVRVLPNQNQVHVSSFDRAEARRNGLNDMTFEEINEGIRAATPSVLKAWCLPYMANIDHVTALDSEQACTMHACHYLDRSRV